jgi:hypothetical protein
MDRVSKSVNYYVCFWPQSKYQIKQKSHLTQHILIHSKEKSLNVLKMDVIKDLNADIFQLNIN